MPSSIDLSRGEYARKQIYCPSGLVRWSHGSRFRMAAALVHARAGGRLLDYGCGDGTFLAMVHDRFAEAVGTDADLQQLRSAAGRLAQIPNLRFVPPGELDADHHTGYDVVTCMEVLEHCLPSARQRVLSELRRLVARDGLVVISVPIEQGLSLAGKQIARRVAGWRGLGDYRFSERYAWAELIRMVAGGRRAAIERPVFQALDADGATHAYLGHKGFNWRQLERDVAVTFEIQDRRYSPVPWLGPVLNSQVWFVCHPR